MSDIPDEFTSKWYDRDYFAAERGKSGKRYRKGNGTGVWSYFNPTGEWGGAEEVTKAWMEMFKPHNLLDIGCGRGVFVAYARDLGIDAEGFDFSSYALNKGRYPRCKPEWLNLHDATEPWPYEDDSFDLVVALDFFEHIYQSDLDFVIDEMYRVAGKWIFLQIATVGGGSGVGIHEKGYVLERGEPVPKGLEGCAVAGHVTVCSEQWWVDRLEREDWILRRDMIQWFMGLVDEEIIKNWILNTLVTLEKVD